MVSTPLKNINQNGNLPQDGVKTENIWNHHLDKSYSTKKTHVALEFSWLHSWGFWKAWYFFGILPKDNMSFYILSRKNHAWFMSLKCSGSFNPNGIPLGYIVFQIWIISLNFLEKNPRDPIKGRLRHDSLPMGRKLVFFLLKIWLIW